MKNKTVKTDPNAPAFPSAAQQWGHIPSGVHQGMSKRELGAFLIASGFGNKECDNCEIARRSMRRADAILDALNEEDR